MPSIRFRYAALLSGVLLLWPADSAFAQDTQPAQTTKASAAVRTLKFLAGGAAGLVVHEAGHLATAAAFNADPNFKRLDYGFIPFFAVTHDQVSRRREYLISSAGFHAQHIANEWLLWRGPAGTDLRASSAPFKKGWLTFNLATSAIYTAAAFAKAGPPERDTRGMAVSVGADGIPEPVVGVLILAPAALDGVRYLKNDPAWARWTSRVLKAGLVILAIR